MARPLFLCHTTLWRSDAVVWTTWNLDRMCTRYRYLSWKIFFQNFFSQNIFKIFFPNIYFSQIFFWKKNSGYFFWFCCSKIICNQNLFCCCWVKFDVWGSLYTCLVLYFFYYRLENTVKFTVNKTSIQWTPGLKFISATTKKISSKMIFEQQNQKKKIFGIFFSTSSDYT